MKILQNKFNSKLYSLNETRRCSRSVSNHVSNYMNFEFISSNNKGMGSIELKQEDFNPRHFNMWENPKNNVILSRWNSSLVRVGLRMMSKDMKFFYRNDMSTPLVWKIKKLGKPNDLTSSINESIQLDYEERLAELVDSELEMTGQEFDTYDTLLAITSPDFAKIYPKISDLTKAISNMGKNKSGINLSTVHSSKGLEYENVVFLDAYKLKGIAEQGDKIEEKNGKITRLPSNEESNIYYVGCTRTKENLCFRNSEYFIPEK